MKTDKLLSKSLIPEYLIKLADQSFGLNVENSWVMLKDGDNVVEGKLYLQPNQDKLVIFEPGFPGGGSTQFEELWLKEVLKGRYSVFLIRHGGTILGGEFTHNYVNCPQRENLAVKNDLGVLGNKPEHTITDWLVEPYTALKALSPHFNEIVLCGHSFGPLALISSYIKFLESDKSLAGKVKRIVSLSGSIGIIRSYKNSIMRVWHDHLDTDWARARVRIGDAKLNTDIFGDAHKFINENANKIPNNVSFIAVTPYGDTEKTVDEIVHPLESIDFINSLGRGYLIIDKMEYGDKKIGRMAHDMESLPANILAKLLDSKWLPEKQISILKEGKLK